MPDQRDTPQDHWRELADLLGLPPEGSKQASSPPPQPRTPEPVKAPKPACTPPPARDFEEPDAQDPDLADEGQGPEEHLLYHEETLVSETIVEDESLAEPAAGQKEEDLEEGPPGRRKRGRRRGRRGRRGEGDEPSRREGGEPSPPTRVEDAEETPEAAPAEEFAGKAAEESDDLEERQERHRGEGRQRRPAERRPREEPEDLDVEETEEASPPFEDDEEEIDKLTDWNVPSWNELIASLYRPER